MRKRRPTLKSARASGKRAASLLLSFVCAPAFAATDSAQPCRSTVADASFALEVPSPRLTPGLRIEVVDHGSPDGLADNAFTGDVDTGGSSLTAPPDAEAMLEEVHDQALDRLGIRLPSVRYDSTSAADVAPGSVSDDTLDEGTDPLDSIVEDTDDTPSTRLPGLSEDAVERYRRQMYRTDI